MAATWLEEPMSWTKITDLQSRTPEVAAFMQELEALLVKHVSIELKPDELDLACDASGVLICAGMRMFFRTMKTSGQDFTDPLRLAMVMEIFDEQAARIAREQP